MACPNCGMYHAGIINAGTSGKPTTTAPFSPRSYASFASYETSPWTWDDAVYRGIRSDVNDEDDWDAKEHLDNMQDTRKEERDTTEAKRHYYKRLENKFHADHCIKRGNVILSGIKTSHNGNHQKHVVVLAGRTYKHETRQDRRNEAIGDSDGPYDENDRMPQDQRNLALEMTYMHRGPLTLDVVGTSTRKPLRPLREAKKAKVNPTPKPFVAPLLPIRHDRVVREHNYHWYIRR